MEMLAQADLGVLDDRVLLEYSVALDRQLTRLQAQRARALRAVDVRQAYRHDACVTTASWWRWRTRYDHDEASRIVRTARRLSWLDETRQAFENGEIGAHAAVIARAAIPRRRDAIVAHETGLVTLAKGAAPRDVDAFDALLRAAEEHPHLPAVHGATPHVLLTIDLATLADQDAPSKSDDDPAVPGRRGPRLGSGVELSLQRAADLLESAKLTPVLMTGPWRAVAVGRTRRTLPAWLRPVLTSIHRHCRGPGCDRPMAWTDAAHLDAWQRGGHTDLERTIPACRSHHMLMDQAGWKVDLEPDTAICTWTSPDDEIVIRTHPPP